MELRDRYYRARVLDKPEPQPGDLVQFEQGLLRLDETDGPIEVILWDYLDMSKPDHRQLFDDCHQNMWCVPGTDCIIAIMSPDGSNLLFYVAPSRHLVVVERGVR